MQKINMKSITTSALFILWCAFLVLAVFAMAVGSLTPVDFIYDGI